MKRVKAKDFPKETLVLTAKDIGAAVRAARTQAGLRMSDAALSLGMAVQTLADIEAGRDSVGLNKVLQAAKGLGVDLFIQPRARRDLVLRRLANLP